MFPAAGVAGDPASYSKRCAHAEPPLDVVPLAGPLACSKTGALYGMHAYWSKKPHDAIRAFIRHHTRPGDLVLDPFCGSGGTAAIASQEGRPAIALDRSPAAVFIARHYSEPADPDRVRSALGQVLARARALSDRDLIAAAGDLGCPGNALASQIAGNLGQLEGPAQSQNASDPDGRDPAASFGQVAMIGRLYATPCDCCGGIAELTATFYDHGEPRSAPVPTEIAYRCRGCGKARRPATDRDRAELATIGRSPVSSRFPTVRMMHRDGPWGDTWRNGTSSFETVDELFTPRNLRAMAALLEAIGEVEDPDARDVLLFAFSAHVFSATTMQQVREGGGGYAKGTYYVPRRFVERNVFSGFTRRVEAVLAGKAMLADGDLLAAGDAVQAVPGGIGRAEVAPARRPPGPCIARADARRLPLSDGCIDYIFTDPPYLDAVQYAELNFLWESWLELDTSWHGDEIVINRTRHLTLDHWKSGMGAALAEMRRVLKPGAWLSLCFAATNLSAWGDLGTLLVEAGFEPGGTVILEPAQKSYNRLKPTKKARHDRVVSWRKPAGKPQQVDLEAWLTEIGRAIETDCRLT